MRAERQSCVAQVVCRPLSRIQSRPVNVEPVCETILILKAKLKSRGQGFERTCKAGEVEGYDHIVTAAQRSPDRVERPEHTEEIATVSSSRRMSQPNHHAPAMFKVVISQASGFAMLRIDLKR
eukprot:3331035-Pleurochrysis_carterae.AAC.1